MMLARALQKKGLCFNAIACEPAEWEVLQKMDSSLFEGSTRNYGIHPMAIADVTEADWERLESLLDNYPDANVGECGLDKRYDGYAEGGLQEQAFRRQVELARNLHRDLHIHCVGDYGRIIKILEECYDDLLALRYAKIGKALGVSTEDVQRAVASFAKLNPHPGFQLSNSRVQTIAADLKVVDKHGHMEVESVRSSMQKRLRVNQTYKAILDDKGASKSDKEYVRTHLFKAVEFIKALDNRYTTMELVMRAIFKRQKDFFKKGPAFLKPMVQQDIADDIKRDVSTVNRSVNGKYVDTPYGIFELKQFFTSGVKQDSSPDGEELSSATILDAIKKRVDEEDKKKPLSDQAIADKLMEQGIKVARRTVAKYREEELHLLPASKRKKLI